MGGLAFLNLVAQNLGLDLVYEELMQIEHLHEVEGPSFVNRNF